MVNILLLFFPSSFFFIPSTPHFWNSFKRSVFLI
jgi:hypothetical protein